jgi:AcrR family transcriptional regulator
MRRRPAKKAPRKSRVYHHGNLRAALIEAGLKLIEEKGAAALTLREIGRRVGVSRMAAYRHFADKADLLGAISEGGFSKFADALETARRGAPANFASRLDAMALAYLRFAAAHSAHYEVMFGPRAELDQPQAPAGSSAQRSFEVLEQTIREGQQAKEIRPGNSVQLARVVWALVHGLSMLRLETDLSENGPGTTFTLFCSEILRTGIAAKGPWKRGRRLRDK